MKYFAVGCLLIDDNERHSELKRFSDVKSLLFFLDQFVGNYGLEHYCWNNHRWFIYSEYHLLGIVNNFKTFDIDSVQKEIEEIKAFLSKNDEQYNLHSRLEYLENRLKGLGIK